LSPTSRDQKTVCAEAVNGLARGGVRNAWLIPDNDIALGERNADAECAPVDADEHARANIN
jgi:hypothetical protein